MTRGLKSSRRAVVAAISSLAVATGMLVLRFEVKGRLAARVSEALQEERMASVQLMALSAFDEEHLRALRERTTRFRLRLGENSTWEQAQGYLGGRWTHEGDTTTEHGAYSTRVHRIRMSAPSIADWPQIVDAVALLEKSPGIQVEGIEMRSSGSAVQRSLDYVGMRLVVQTRSESAEKFSR